MVVTKSDKACADMTKQYIAYCPNINVIAS